MCVVSMVMDHTLNKVPDWVWQQKLSPEVSRYEFDQLKKQVEDMLELIKKAKLYDEETAQPDCEDQDKLAKLRRVAEVLDLDLEKYLK